MRNRFSAISPPCCQRIIGRSYITPSIIPVKVSHTTPVQLRPQSNSLRQIASNRIMPKLKKVPPKRHRRGNVPGKKSATPPPSPISAKKPGTPPSSNTRSGGGCAKTLANQRVGKMLPRRRERRDSRLCLPSTRIQMKSKVFFLLLPPPGRLRCHLP